MSMMLIGAFLFAFINQKRDTMSSGIKTFATAFNCMDGRCQEIVRQYVMKTYGVDYVDAITGAGMDALLPEEKRVHESQPSLAWWKFEADISANKHGSKRAVVIGHENCGGNGVSNDEHLSDIHKAVEVVRSWGLFETVEGLISTEGADGEFELRSLEEARKQAA